MLICSLGLKNIRGFFIIKASYFFIPHLFLFFQLIPSPNLHQALSFLIIMKITKLARLKKLTPIGELQNDQVRELQKALNTLGYNAGSPDGIPGSKTRSSWLQLMADTFGSNMILLGPDAAKLLEFKLADKNDNGGNGDDDSEGELKFKLSILTNIRTPKPVDRLNRDQLRELQTALFRLGYPIGTIDGLFGPKTRNAWGEFEADAFGGNQLLVGPVSVDMLQTRLNNGGGGRVHDFSNKEGTIEAIKWECKAQEIGLKTQIAYVLATTEWETARTFKPVREAFWLDEDWRRENLRYFPYYGRGYVQLTWENNYKKYSDILGVDMVANADLAMDENIALFVLVHGFKTGTFTGRKITDYINVQKTDFIGARRCINGTDKAEEIARLAQKYLDKL